MTSQTNQDEVQLMQSLYGMEKRDIVAEFVEISEAQATEFWALYDEYENQRKELGRKKYQLLQSFVDDYGQVKAAGRRCIYETSHSATNQVRQTCTDNYYKKVKSKTDPIVAMQFYQIENYLADAIKNGTA